MAPLTRFIGRFGRRINCWAHVMLSLTDPIWLELQGGYRMPYDASKALAQMEGGESVWDELWNELHHQGDVGVASYAAIPQLVRISEARRGSDWNL